MKARPLLAAALAIIVGSSARVWGADADGGELDRLMALLAQRQHGEADFSEKKYLSLLKKPLESSGVLIYQAPDHLEQRTTLPRPQVVVLDHGIVTMQIGKRTRVLRLADYPQFAPLIDSMRATLAGDRAGLERVFELGFSGTLDHWQLHLQPRDARLAATLTLIEMRGERDAVREVQVQQSDGDRSLMSITPRE
ncbi:MAG TPA: outer membrane lipoprotein carrier protein LolA [Steroidobacteraceae bacterium]